ncbi:PorP/SprF family type IX secretion system membrane protein [Marivirga sp.]|uniref:PorP/SprF family type IX secretion system membrane protein n=1 Tax=Marivirga sp. TaxID=2018662 RepID=UPI003DA74E27
MKKLFIFLFIIFNSASIISAQNLPIYNQYYFNPYLYNPSYLTNEGIEFNLTYRRQWADVVDAPEIVAFNFQYANKSNFAYGLSVQSESSVLLNTNTAYLTLGYKVPFSENHYIRFGLSIGTIQNTLDFNTLANTSDPEIFDDPAILNAVDNNYYLSSQFGFNYQYRAFKIGASLPKFFDNSILTTEQINTPVLDQLQKFIITSSYNFNLSQNFSFKPFALYRHVNKVQYQAELIGIFDYKKFMWLGGGYRYESGPIGHVGFNLNDIVKFSYSYEFAGINTRSFGGASHEVNLKIKLKRRERNKLDKLDENEKLQEEEFKESKEQIAEKEVTLDSIQSEKILLEEKRNEIEKVIEEVDSVKSVIIAEDVILEKDTIDKTEKESKLKSNLNSGYYLIVGVFSTKENADKLMNMISENNMKSDRYLNEKNNLHYVYLEKKNSREEILIYYHYVRDLPYFDFKDAWILTVD